MLMYLMGSLLRFFLYNSLIKFTRIPHSIPIPTTVATPSMLHSTCLGFKSFSENLFFCANVVSNEGHRGAVKLVIYVPLNLIGAAQLKNNMGINKMALARIYSLKEYFN